MRIEPMLSGPVRLVFSALLIFVVACSEREAARFEGHTGAVNSVAVSPTGGMIASGSDDGSVRVWSPSGQSLQTIGANAGGVGAVAFSPDGEWIASGATGTSDRSVRLWNARSGELVRTVGEDHGTAKALIFLSEGREIFIGGAEGISRLYDVELAAALREYDSGCFAASARRESDGETETIFVAFMDSVRMLDRDTGAERGRFASGVGVILSLAVSADGATAVTGGADGAIRVWGVASGGQKAVIEAHEGSVAALAMTRDGLHAISGGGDGRVFQWDLASGERLKKFKGHKGGVGCVALLPGDMKAITGGVDGMLKVWELDGGKGGVPEPNTFAQSEEATAPSETPREKTSVVAAGNSGTTTTLPAETVHAAPVAKREMAENLSDEPLVLKSDSASVRTATFSTDGLFVLTCAGSELILWDSQSGEALRHFKGHTAPVSSAAFASGGRRILSGGEDASLRLWDVETGETVRVIQADAAHSIATVAISQDALQLLSGGLDGTLRLWNAETGEEVRRFEGHTDGVLSAAFSPDGRRAVSGGLDQTVRLWYVFSGRQIREIKVADEMGFIWGAGFSPDGLRAISGGSDKTVRVWDVKEGAELARFSGHEQMVRCVAFSPDGTRALSGGADGIVILWRVDPPGEIARFSGHADMVTSVAFSPDGARAVSGSADKTARVWALPEN